MPQSQIFHHSNFHQDSRISGDPPAKTTLSAATSPNWAQTTRTSWGFVLLLGYQRLSVYGYLLRCIVAMKKLFNWG